MNRTEFEEYLARTLWRTGDVPLEADMGNLIRAGESRLSRDLLVIERLTILNYTLTDPAPEIPYPADFYSLRGLWCDGPWTYVTPTDYSRLAEEYANSKYYTLDGSRILLARQPFSAASLPTFGIHYYTKLPTFSDAETWLQEEYFDLYTHACLMHSATYLREDNRLAVWGQLYAENLESARTADAAKKYNGSPLKARMPGVVA